LAIVAECSIIWPSISATQLLETVGCAVIPGILPDDQIQYLSRLITSLADATHGTRKLLDKPWCSELAEQLRVDPRLQPLLPSNAQVVQCTLFVKSVEKNWLVSLHQDLSIPVAERVESSQCSGWSQKEGDLFVQPPVAVLEDIVALRVHLDHSDESNGALRVVSGSHRLGRLTSSAAMEERNRCGECSVAVPRGGVMVMRPLLLHASSKASNNTPRRVLHFVFGPSDLSEGLRWPVRKQSVLNAC
jgi:ectoine hydroxylase-related dioxygenase (phytanoyl-CoA dioxygenase family)